MDLHERTLAENAEELLERLWTESIEREQQAIQVADLGLTEDDQRIENLVRLDLVRVYAKHVELTAAGRDAASTVIRRHRLAERMVSDVLAVGGERMDETACGIEHSLRAGVDEAVCSLLGHPDTCPHGKPIPAGECCREARIDREIVPMTSLRPGQQGRIAYVQTDEARRLQKLMAMGVLPGKTIRLIQGFPSYVFQIGHSQFAVDREIARTIHVRMGCE